MSRCDHRLRVARDALEIGHCKLEADHEHDQPDHAGYGKVIQNRGGVGNPIGEARLEVLPYATLCIEDAQKAEKGIGSN